MSFLSKLDPGQVLQNASDDVNNALRVTVVGGPLIPGNPIPVTTQNALIKDPYDYIDISYIASGNGAGQPGTVVYKEGGSGGAVVGTLTLSYDSNNNLTSVALS